MFVFMLLVYHGDFREPGEAHAGSMNGEQPTLRRG